MLTTILFDLDGTLLPMDQDAFNNGYFKLLTKKMMPHGYEPKKLISSLWKGIYAMMSNDGTDTNENVFWRVFSEIYGEDACADKPLFDSFYRNEYQQSKSLCGFQPESAKTVYALKEQGYRIVLATTPVYPAVATESRIRWAGLKPEDFELYTTYENSCFCKPNLNYYMDVFQKMNVRPEDCLMVGNDVSEDMAAEKTGAKVFLLTDCLINRENKDLSEYPNGGFKELQAYIPEIAQQ